MCIYRFYAMKQHPRFVLVLMLGLLASAAHAQSPAADDIAQGIEAYRAERYEDALRAFEAATAADPNNAEAYFLLARVFFDTPLRDEQRAAQAIDRARELDPENLNYMVAELQQLRTDTWNFIQEIQRTSKRVALAQQILRLDPDNSFAHEELGTYFIRDYWYYRNAIAFPTLTFNSRGVSPVDDISDEVNDATYAFGDELPNTDDAPPSSPVNASEIAGVPEFEDIDQLTSVNATDRFDIETLRTQGAATLDLSARADRAYERAIFHLEKALASDPRRRSVYDHLMRVRALAGDWDQALEMLTQMLVYFPEDEQMWRYLGLANHRAGRDDAAATSFREAFERMTPEERTVFDDITLLLPVAEVQAYQSDPENVARRFWTSQEPRFLTPFNERKLEHYSRLTYADLMYRSDDLNLPGWETERGKIYVRYGEPRSDVIITGGFQEVLESFRTRAAGSSRQGFDRAAFETAPEMMQSNRFNVWDYGDFKFVFEDPIANGEFRLYSPPADLFAVAGGAAVERMDYEIIARETFRETPERYDYAPAGRQIGLPYLVTSFKGDDGRTDLYVHYGIPIAQTFDPSQHEVVDLTVQTGAFLISEDRDLLFERRRTLYGLNTSQVESFEDTKLWTDTQSMEAPPGAHTISVEFETVGGGTSAVQRREIEGPAYPDDRLALSSLMLAYIVEETDETAIPGLVVRDGLAIQPAPWSVFNHEHPVYLFFEVYNLGLEGGRSNYEIEAEMRPKDTSSGLARLARNLFGGRDRGVSTAYERQSDLRDEGQYVILDVLDQEPGFYTLTLRITDRVSGRSVEETTDLYLE